MTLPGPDGNDERGPVVAVLRLFGLQIAAVIGIAAVITAVVALLSSDDGGKVSAVPGAASAPATSAPPTSAPATKAPSPTAPATSAPSSSTPATTASSPGGPAAPVKVDVLNQSAASGASERVAERLRAAGWEVGRVDNFQGNVRTTTVYWLSPEDRRQARQVARFLGGVRVLQGFSTLVDGRVSVILVDGRW